MGELSALRWRLGPVTSHLSSPRLVAATETAAAAEVVSKGPCVLEKNYFGAAAREELGEGAGPRCSSRTTWLRCPRARRVPREKSRRCRAAAGLLTRQGDLGFGLPPVPWKWASA
ncbi:uncharacterized protein LOC720037 [Macaca mulatta]